MQVAAGIYREIVWRLLCSAHLLLLLSALLFLAIGCAKTAPVNIAPVDIQVLEKWSGDFPVAELDRLPDGQQESAAGYIGDAETFLSVWRAFKPTEILPAIDFNKNIALFTRNIQFYNRQNILKVTLKDGTAEIITMETMSAIPIEEKVAMTMAVIPREGIRDIQAGPKKVRVMPYK